jgi:hypothetical protein
VNVYRNSVLISMTANGNRKWLHRRVCQNYLPRHILKRKKRGFAVNVVDDWFRSSLNCELSEVLLDKDSFLFKLLRPAPGAQTSESPPVRPAEQS